MRIAVVVALVGLCSCVGLQSYDLDAVEVRRGADLAIAEHGEPAQTIVDRLDVFGVPLAEMPRRCGLPEYGDGIDADILEGCAMWPGSLFARARIYVATDRDDTAAIVDHEIAHLARWQAEAGPPGP